MLACRIKQAARSTVSSSYAFVAFLTKARDQRYKKAEEKSTGKFGTFPHQMLTDYIEEMRKVAAGDESNRRSILSFLSNCICFCRRRRGSASSQINGNSERGNTFLESMFMALTGSPEFRLS